MVGAMQRSLSFAISAALAATLTGCDTSTDPAHTRTPDDAIARSTRLNILLVVLDTVRADRLSSYGYDRPTTPEIDSLSRDFVRFEEFYATSPWTIPSHASIFTGLYPVEHQATQEHLVLDDRFTTLAEILSGAGYETWAASGNPFMGPAANLAQGFETFVEAWRGTPITRPEGSPHPVNESFELFLETRDSTLPFFAFLNYMDAHEPFAPPASYARRFLRAGLPLDEALTLGNRGWRKHWSEEPFSQDQLAVRSDLYDAGLSQLSRYVGRMIELVQERGLYDHTVIVITSDHGEHFGENGSVGHFFSLYNTVVRVPLFIRVPGAREGRVERGKGQLVDLFPTLLRLAGVDSEDFQHRGKDLLDPNEHRSSVFAEYYYPAQVLELFSPAVREREAERLEPHLRRRRAVQAFGFRLIWSSDGRHELYRVATDPGETTNLLTGGNLGQEAQEFMRLLEGELERYTTESEPQTALAPQRDLDPATLEALEALGYLESVEADSVENQ